MNIIKIGNIKLHTLIAYTEEEQARGLMWKKWPPPVMSFIYDTPGIKKFWMKNTISPLDIVFCKDNKVIAIKSGEPNSLDLIGPNKKSDLVVELPKGTVKKLGIKVGQAVTLTYSLETLAQKFICKLAQKHI